jgi:hypothetical protein
LALTSLLLARHALLLLRIVPGAGSTVDVLLLLLGESLALEVALGEDILVGTCAAFEAVLGRAGLIFGVRGWEGGDGEEVRTIGANWG